MGKVRFLVINVLNDCCICMCLIVCIYVGMSGRIPFGGGENVKPWEKLFFFFFFKMSESVILSRNGTDKTLDLSLDLG